MNNHRDENKKLPEEEIYISDVILFFNQNKKVLIISMLLSMLVGVFYSFGLQSQYEATVKLRLTIVDGEAVETPAELAEKLMLPFYFSTGTNDVCNYGGGGASKPFISKIKSVVGKNPSDIMISYRDGSTKAAEACLEAIVSDVRADQSRLSKSIAEAYEFELKILEKKMDLTNEFLKKFSRQGNVQAGRQLNIDPNVLFMVLSAEKEVADISNEIFQLNKILKGPKTKQLYLLAPVRGSDVAVEPRRPIIILLFAVIGLILGFGYASGRRILRKYYNEQNEKLQNK